MLSIVPFVKCSTTTHLLFTTSLVKSSGVPHPRYVPFPFSITKFCFVPSPANIFLYSKIYYRLEQLTFTSGYLFVEDNNLTQNSVIFVQNYYESSLYPYICFTIQKITMPDGRKGYNIYARYSNGNGVDDIPPDNTKFTLGILIFYT